MTPNRAALEAACVATFGCNARSLERAPTVLVRFESISNKIAQRRRCYGSFEVWKMQNVPLILDRHRLKVDPERAQLAIQMRALHADAFRELSDLAVTEHELLLKVSAFELFARLS